MAPSLTISSTTAITATTTTTNKPRSRPPPISLSSKQLSQSHSHSSNPCSPKGCPAAIHAPPTPPPNFPLLSFPPEVVGLIVEHAVIAPEPVIIHEPRFNRHRSPPPRARSRPRLDRKVPPTSPGIPAPKIERTQTGEGDGAGWILSPPRSRVASPEGTGRGDSLERRSKPRDGSRSNSQQVDKSRTGSKPRSESKSKVGKKTHTRESSLDLSKARREQTYVEKPAEVGHTLLALLLTSRQLYAPYWATYYSQNTFVFHSLDTFLRFQSSLPPRCTNQIRNLTLYLPRKHRHDQAWNMLGKMKRLKELEVYLKHAETVNDADVGEWEQLEDGARTCNALELLILRREGVNEGVEKDLAEGTQEDTVQEGHNGELNAEVQVAQVEQEAADHDPGDGVDEPEDGSEEEGVSGIEQVLRRDRQVEAKINIRLKERLDQRAKLRKGRQQKATRSEVYDFPADDSDG